MKNFSCDIKNRKGEWINTQVIPDYHNGGNNNGPLAWVRVNGERTGVALAIGGCERVAEAHSISFTSTRENRDCLQNFTIDEEQTPFDLWEKQLIEACYAMA